MKVIRGISAFYSESFGTTNFFFFFKKQEHVFYILKLKEIKTVSEFGPIPKHNYIAWTLIPLNRKYKTGAFHSVAK